MTVQEAQRILGGWVPTATEAEQKEAYTTFWNWYNASARAAQIAAEMKGKVKVFDINTIFDPQATAHGYNPAGYATQEATEVLAEWMGGEAYPLPSGFKLYNLWCVKMTDGGERTVLLQAALLIDYLTKIPVEVAIIGIKGLLPFDWTPPATPSPFSPVRL